MGAFPAPVRAAVLREIVAAALPPGGVPDADPLPALVRQLSPFSIPALNALHFAHASVPDAALAAVEREGGFGLLAEGAAGGALGGGAQAGVARDLLAALLERGGWSHAAAAQASAAPAPLVGERTPLAPSLDRRFGRLRLTGGDVLTLASAEPGKASGAFAPVAFYNPATQQTRVLRPGESWRLQGHATEEWLFRLGAETSAVQLRAVPPQAANPVASASAAELPALEAGQVYTVEALPPEHGRADAPNAGAGWMRVPWVKAGDRIRLSTFDLTEGVDTLVEIHRGGTKLDDDDDADGLASRLDWVAEREGAVLVRLVNIGEPGTFRVTAERLAAERLAAAPVETATGYGRLASQPNRPR